MGMNLANDTVTVVNRTDTGYVTNAVHGVFWYREKSITIQGSGVADSRVPACIFPYDALKNYTDSIDEVKPGRFTLRMKDFVILGEVSGITSVKDINRYDDVITITALNRHLKGSERVRHITVS